MELVVFSTNMCNINCKHCFINRDEELFPPNINIISEIIDSSQKAGINRLTFSGGEPLLFWSNLKTILRKNNE